MTGSGAEGRTSSLLAVGPQPPLSPATVSLAPRRLLLAAVAVLAPLGLLGALTDRAIQRTLAEQLAHELEGKLGTAIAALEAWVEDTALLARAAAADPEVQRALAEGAPLAPAVAPFVRAGGFLGFAVVQGAAERPALAASGPLADLWAAPTEPLRRHLAAAIARAPVQPRATGGAIFVPPFLAAPERPAMLIGASLSPGGPAASPNLFLQLPLARFARVLQAARAGASGESYAFDAVGRLLSESRFNGQLLAAGLLRPGEDSAAFRVLLRDLAARALPGQDGRDVEGYRDYRGVKVVGAWRWLPHHGFGVTTEIDHDEAFRIMRPLRRFFAGLLVLLAALAAGLAVVARINAATRLRARRAEQQVAALGQYKLIRKLGQGGMGTVYLASHAFLRRPTAIKVLRDDRTGPEFLARFEREVQATSELTHPNTVAIYDYGHTPDGVLYYAMEYVEGASFETLVRRFGPQPPGRVIHLCRQVCGSLREAHGRGLIHRDIKPSNLFVCRRGGQPDLVKVLDFGLAKWYRPVDHPTGPVTESLTVVGTPEYMAPELFESTESASPQSDIYALGAVAYYLLTGARVFDASSLAALATAHLSRQPLPPSARLDAPIDPALESAIMSCLAKQPAARPAGAGALAWLLERSPAASGWDSQRAEAWWTEHQEQLLRDEEAPAPLVAPAETQPAPVSQRT